MSSNDGNLLFTPKLDRNIRFRTPTKTNNDNNKVEDLTGPYNFKSRSEESEATNLRKDKNSTKDPSLMQFLFVELTRGYLLEHDEARFSARREKVYSFMKIPREVEKFMAYGFFQCADSFLFVYTFLPMRFVLALFAFITRPIRECFGMYKTTSRGILNPAEICDLLKGCILIICTGIILYIDTSMMYHLIKSQSVIKLYIFFNMLEVGDRLFSAFGQDVIDALFWTATEPKDRKREHLGLIPHIIFAVIYVFLHSLVVLFQATTLNVAINSNNKSLLTIMMSNNFVELKGSVFKKFDKNNLFQVSCSDVRERFHLFVLLFIVVIQTMKEYSWKEDRFWVLLPDCVCVLVAEVLIDWIKHAFITRFNELNIEVYKDYTLSIAYDIAQTRQKHAFSDHSDLVARRMGFIPLPLGVVMFRVLVQALHIEGTAAILITLVAYLCLLSFRVLNSLVLLGKACDLMGSHRQQDNLSTSMRAPSPQPPPPVTHAPPHDHQPMPRVDAFLQPPTLAQPQPPGPLGAPAIFTNSLVSINKISLNEALLPTQNVTDTKDINKENLEKKVDKEPLKETVDDTQCSEEIEDIAMKKRAESEPSIPLLVESDT